MIADANKEQGGVYICTCYTDDGETFSSTYELHVAQQAQRIVHQPSVEHAEVGSDVVLRCKQDHYSAQFKWTRQHGQFAPDQDTSSVGFFVLLDLFKT